MIVQCVCGMISFAVTSGTVGCKECLWQVPGWYFEIRACSYLYNSLFTNNPATKFCTVQHHQINHTQVLKIIVYLRIPRSLVSCA
jgi:hypothetical protein